MASFVGRLNELKKLDDAYEYSIKTCYIDARPRSGATALVKRFCEKSKVIYTTFTECTPREALRSFRNALESFTSEPIEQENPTFADLFQVLSRIVKEYDPIVVFDGTQYAPDDFPNQVRWFAEEHNCMVILIGHGDSERYHMTFCEKFSLDDLSLGECSLLHTKMVPLDRLKTYMVTGGTPLYHMLMNKQDFQTSVEKAFIDGYPRLVAECEHILRKSSVPYATCTAILDDISRFIGRPVDIAETEGISRQLCDIYLKKLVEEDLIQTITPIGDAPKKPVYIIKNALIAFYFIVIRRNPDIEFTEKATYQDIAPHVDMFMELRFRDICQQYLENHYKCQKVGRWWMKDEDTQKPTLVAIIDTDEGPRTIVADCKFRKGKIDTGALKTFSARASEICDVPEKQLIMFSISGFEDKLVKKAKQEGITLVGPEAFL